MAVGIVATLKIQADKIEAFEADFKDLMAIVADKEPGEFEPRGKLSNRERRDAKNGAYLEEPACDRFGLFSSKLELLNGLAMFAAAADAARAVPAGIVCREHCSVEAETLKLIVLFNPVLNGPGAAANRCTEENLRRTGEKQGPGGCVKGVLPFAHG